MCMNDMHFLLLHRRGERGNKQQHQQLGHTRSLRLPNVAAAVDVVVVAAAVTLLLDRTQDDGT